MVGDIHYVRRAVPWAKETIGLSARLCLFCYFQPTTACLVTNAPNGAISSLAQGNTLGMYGYFIKRPERTKVKSVKVYAQDNTIQPKA